MTVAGYLTRWLFLGLCLVVLSCSSDGGGTGGSGSASASGRATAVDDLVVTGIAFDTSDATILVNGEPGTEADLQLGQVLTVEGTLDDDGGIATAKRVIFDRNAAGPIDSINFETNTLVVLGQIVVVDDATQFGATAFDELVVGNVVEVSGFEDTNGTLRATRIDKTQDALTPGFEIETTGTVSNLDTANQTFTLNMLQVDFSTAELRNIPGDQLANGQMVQVTSTDNVVNGVLVADRVEGKDVAIDGEEGQRAELEGLITSLSLPDGFAVNGQAVQLTADTVLKEGTIDDLALNVRVEVEGVFDEQGAVVAETVEIETGGEIELEGVVTSVTPPDTFEVTGQVVRITSETEYSGGDVNDIVVDAQLQVEGFFDAEGIFIATGIEFFVDIEGFITSVTLPGSFEVDGQAVQLTSETVFEGGTINDLALNVRVEVEGLFDDAGVLVATAVEFLQ